MLTFITQLIIGVKLSL